MHKMKVLFAIAVLCVTSSIARVASAAPKAQLISASVRSSAAVVRNHAKPLATTCPDGSVGALNSVGVPVDQQVALSVLSPPAPAGGYYWNVYSSDTTIAAAGDRTQGFIPQLFTPEGQTVSNSFTLYGVGVGQASLVIQDAISGETSSETPLTAWGVNPGNDSVFLDANFFFNSCVSPTSGNVSTDPSILSQCGGNIDGITTDGVSQLLFRSVSGLPGTACFSITSDSQLDQGAVNTSVTSTQPVNGKHYGFSTYAAPSYYGDSSDSRQVQIEFSFLPNIGNSNTTTITAPFTVIRPPVILVHGLWSDPSTWTNAIWDRHGAAFPDYDTFRADYASTNASPFATNFPSIKKDITDTLDTLHSAGYAATQADVIGHSMGGILTRLYAGSSANHRASNYNQGDIHRLITIDTPHAGASLANLIVSMNANSTIFALIGDLAAGVRSLGFTTPTIDQGAICDLSENSPALAGLSAITLPTRVISGTGGPTGTRSGGKYMATLEKNLTRKSLLGGPLFPQDVVDGFRFRQANDAIVALTSQQALTGGSSNFNANVHTDILQSAAVASVAFMLLDGPSTAFLAGVPGIPSDSSGAPGTVPGLGHVADANDYATQCGGVQTAVFGARTGGVSALPTARNASQLPKRGITPAAVSPLIRIVSPAAGETFLPGATVDVTVQVDSAIHLIYGVVGSTVPNVDPLVGDDYDGHTFHVSFVIPRSFAGPATLTPAAVDSNNVPYRGAAVSLSVVPGDAPTHISLVQGNFAHIAEIPSSAHVYVVGDYADGQRRNIGDPASGTVFSSSNPNVVTVDGHGDVEAIAFGTAVVTAQNHGLKTFMSYVVESDKSPSAPQSVDGSLGVSSSGLQLDRSTGFYVQTLTIRNSLSVPIPGPLYLVLSGLPKNVTAVGSIRGRTRTIMPTGSPYVKIGLPDQLMLQPGSSTTVKLQFLNPGRARISYKADIYRESSAP